MSDAQRLSVSEVEDVEYYIFHETSRESMHSILEDGFNPLYDRGEMNDEQYLDVVAELTGREYPVDRANSSFFYVSLDDVRERESYHGDVVVVDARELSFPVWVGSVKLYDEIVFDAPTVRNGSELDEDELALGIAYLESLYQVEYVGALTEAASLVSSPEVIVDSEIGSDAIVGYVSI